MALPRRVPVPWTHLLRPRTTAAARSAHGRLAGRQARTRGYATEHGAATKSSDIPWFLGAVGVTAPILWYIGIWKPDPNDHHGHDSHDEHAKKDEGKDDSSDEGGDEDKDDGKDDDSDKSADKSSGEGKKDDAKVDQASPQKEAKSSNQMSGKQEGVANADTKHSTNPTEEGKSSKPEGGADTAKSKGTVDVERTQK